MEEEARKRARGELPPKTADPANLKKKKDKRARLGNKRRRAALRTTFFVEHKMDVDEVSTLSSAARPGRGSAAHVRYSWSCGLCASPRQPAPPRPPRLRPGRLCRSTLSYVHAAAAVRVARLRCSPTRV
jgi:hypothetical protein